MQSISADVLPPAVDLVGLVAVLTTPLGEARAGLEVPDAREIGALAPMVPTVVVQVAAVRGPSEIPRAGRSADEQSSSSASVGGCYLASVATHCCHAATAACRAEALAVGS